MIIEGNIEAFKANLKAKSDRRREQLADEYHRALSEMESDHESRLQQLKKNHSARLEHEKKKISERSERETSRTASLKRQHVIDQLFDELKGTAMRKAKRNKTKQLEKDKAYLAEVKRILKRTGAKSITAHTDAFEKELDIKVDVDTTITGIIIDTETVTYDLTLDAFLDEHQDSLKQELIR
ncbi:MAG: hypothetical protein ACOCZV_00935 [Nanoarchaeota archaeon]